VVVVRRGCRLDRGWPTGEAGVAELPRPDGEGEEKEVREEEEVEVSSCLEEDPTWGPALPTSKEGSLYLAGSHAYVLSMLEPCRS
jgi:hypothetical protein